MAVCWNVWTGTQLSGGCFSSGLGWTRSTTCALFAKTTGSHCLDYSGCIYQLLFTFNQEPILLCSCPTKTSFLVATNIFWYLDLICGFRKEMQTRMWIYSLDSPSRLNCLPSICHESTAMLESIAAEWHQFSSKMYFCATMLLLLLAHIKRYFSWNQHEEWPARPCWPLTLQWPGLHFFSGMV